MSRLSSTTPPGHRRTTHRAPMAAARRPSRDRLGRCNRHGRCADRPRRLPPDWWPAATRLLIRRVRCPGPIQCRPLGPATPDPAPPSAVITNQRTHRRRHYLRLLVPRDQPRRIHTRARGHRRALVPAPHGDRKHLPGQQTRCGSASPLVEISTDQHGVDMECVTRSQHRWLAAPVHRQHPTPP